MPAAATVLPWQFSQWEQDSCLCGLVLCVSPNGEEDLWEQSRMG